MQESVLNGKVAVVMGALKGIAKGRTLAGAAVVVNSASDETERTNFSKDSW